MSVCPLSGNILPKIDVLLPTYNTITLVGGDVLQQQVDSILGQHGVEVRVLITDDCSSDGTFDFLLRTCADDPRIILQRNLENQGQMATLTAMLVRVEADYFAFCDHDDVWLSSKLEVTLEQMLRENSDLAYTDLFLVDEKLAVIAESTLAASGMNGISGCHPLSVLLKNPVHGCTILARSTLIKEALPIAEEIPLHDRYFALLASCRRGLSYCEGRQILYRQHGANTVGTATPSPAGLALRSQGNLRLYLSNRLANRRSYLAAWLRWNPKSKTAIFLAFHARQAMVIRLIMVPCYLAISLAEAFRIGLLAILVDAVLTTFASKVRLDSLDSITQPTAQLK